MLSTLVAPAIFLTSGSTFPIIENNSESIHIKLCEYNNLDEVYKALNEAISKRPSKIIINFRSKHSWWKQTLNLSLLKGINYNGNEIVIQAISSHVITYDEYGA